MIKVVIKQGDIVVADVDVIVNAAKNSLLDGKGVNGAIHRAAGPGLLEECKSLGECETGSVKISSAYNLPFAKKIIHAVGPVYEGGKYNERGLLYSCYKDSLELAEQNKFRSIAFPPISCNVYSYPVIDAVQTPLDAIADFARSGYKAIWGRDQPYVQEIQLINFFERDHNIMKNVLTLLSIPVEIEVVCE